MRRHPIDSPAANDLAAVRQGLEDRVETVVTSWQAALAPTGYAPIGAQEQLQILTEHARALLDALVSQPFVPQSAKRVGEDLVKLGYTRGSSLARTLEVLGDDLVRDLAADELSLVQPRLAAVMAELASGFAGQMTERILGEQESIREALLAQREEAEHALRESEARFRTIFEGSPFGIAVSDMQGRLLAANPALQSILGYTEDEMRGRVILTELTHPDDAEAGHRAFMELAEGRSERYEIEQRYFDRNGRVIWAELAMALVRDAQGRPRFAIAMGQDITERKQAEAERMQLLREQAARAEAEAAQERVSFLAEVSAQLATSLDYETTLRQVARSVVPRMADWCTLTIIDKAGEMHTVASEHSTAMGERLAAEVRHEYRGSGEELNSPVRDVLVTGRPLFVPVIEESVLRSISRDERHLDLWHRIAPRSAMIVPLVRQRGVLGTLSMITTADSNRTYAAQDLALAEDLARRAALAVENAQLYAQAQAATRTAEDAVRAREQFLSVAAHELKTPVTSLRGFAQLTLRALEHDAELDRARLRHALMVVNQQSDKLTRLVAQLLDISRIQAGRLALELRTVDLNQLILDLVTAMQHQSQEHTLHFDARAHVLVRIDPLRIEQVLTNLLDNAIKYSPHGGPIDIELGAIEGGAVRIAVRDRGPGIPVEHRARIFERFYQAGAAAEHAAGMGLGLFISREIVELHGGAITAEFPPDGGARFVVTLPSGGPAV